VNPTIVIPAYNRPASLDRLLASAANAVYPAGVPLVISIDWGGDRMEEVRRVATDYHWPHGEKRIINHQRHLGLTGNVFFCGDLSQQLGDIILLEDDLYVSPSYYAYARQALDYYREDDRISGISLNALWFNGYTHQPFIPYLDDADVYFLQVPWYQGQAYTKEKWSAFARWRMRPDSANSYQQPLHEMFASFPATDWFPLKTRYLSDTGRYYVMPRQSLTTNFGERGTHFSRETRFFQVPLQTLRHSFRLHGLDDAVAVYDSFQEILPDRLNRLTVALAGYEFDIDLNATKSPKNLKHEYVLTTRRCSSPRATFAKVMRPMEANVIEAVTGKGINFCRKSDIDFGWLATQATARSNQQYFNRQRSVPRRRRLLFGLLHLLETFDRN